jgi:presenilin-like A22 family membrane protease
LELKRIEHRQLVQIMAIFAIVQFGGLFLAVSAYSGVTYSEITQVQAVSSGSSAALLIIYIVAFSAMFVIISRIYKGNKLFLFLEAYIIFIASLYMFGMLLSIPGGGVMRFLYGSGSVWEYAAGAAIGVLLVFAKNKIPRLRNTTAMIASIGVGTILGITFSFTAALIFMIILAVYDFIAVFITKHMITIANAAISMNLSFMVTANDIEAVPFGMLSKEEYSTYIKAAKGDKAWGRIAKRFNISKYAPVSASVGLGTGDLAMPLMLAVSAYKVYLSFTFSIFIILGAVLGLFITMMILRNYRRALPAIPPLLFGILISIGVYMLLMPFF